jgi:hypothetical protein
MALRLPRHWKRALRRLGGVALAASAVAPAASAGGGQLGVPRHLSFGNASVQTSVEYNATLTNRSGKAIHIYGIGVSSDTGSFTMGPNNGCTGATLPPHSSCTYGIVYAPVKPGRQTGTSDVEFGTSGLAIIKLSAHATAHSNGPAQSAPVTTGNTPHGHGPPPQAKARGHHK